MEKINTTIFNDLFENSIRILLLLHELDPLSASGETLCALDYIAIYGKSFGLTTDNLHGNNPYSISEYISKRTRITDIIKKLVLHSLIAIECCPTGYKYRINARGLSYVKGLDSNYAYLYQESARMIIDALSNKTENELIDIISNQKGNCNG